MAYKYKYRLILFFAAELKITLVILGGDIFSSWVVSARSEICYWLQTPVIPTSSPTVASNKEALPPQLRLITTPSFSVSAFACRTIRKHKEKSMNKNHIRLRFFVTAEERLNPAPIRSKEKEPFLCISEIFVRGWRHAASFRLTERNRLENQLTALFSHFCHRNNSYI